MLLCGMASAQQTDWSEAARYWTKSNQIPVAEGHFHGVFRCSEGKPSPAELRLIPISRGLLDARRSLEITANSDGRFDFGRGSSGKYRLVVGENCSGSVIVHELEVKVPSYRVGMNSCGGTEDRVVDIQLSRGKIKLVSESCPDNF